MAQCSNGNGEVVFVKSRTMETSGSATRRILCLRSSGYEFANRRRPGAGKHLVKTEILLRHSSSGEPLLKLRSHLTSIELAKPSDRLDSLCFAWRNKAGDAIVDNFRHRAGLECDNGRTAGHCLDHHEAERFWPVDRKQ